MTDLISREAAIADRIEKQVKATRGVMKSCGIDKGDLETLELLTGHFLDMAADLRALPAHHIVEANKKVAAQAPAVSIKPLVWENRYPGIWASELYDIFHQWGGDGWYHASRVNRLLGRAETIGRFTALEAAKSAAQQDYESRILAALDLAEGGEA